LFLFESRILQLGRHHKSEILIPAFRQKAH
jgi:hypothetical protein